MSRIIPLFSLLIILAGCSNYTDIQSSLKSFVGKDADVAIARLGTPSDTIERQNYTIYIWETGQRDSISREFYTQGPPQGAGSDVADETVFGDTTSFNCAIKLTANADNVITTWDLDRGLSRCRDFHQRLSYGK